MNGLTKQECSLNPLRMISDLSEQYADRAMHMLKAFRMPKPVKIMGRTSSITNAFVNGIIPCISPSDDDILIALKVLEQDENDVRCAYCGDPMTEWDHLNPLIMDQRPTGYISEIANLVPSCGKCNQSKGNSEWKKWVYGNAKLSPRGRGIKNIDHRAKLIENYESEFHPRILVFEEIVGKELWNRHWKNHQDLLNKMKEVQELSNIIKDKIAEEEVGRL